MFAEVIRRICLQNLNCECRTCEKKYCYPVLIQCLLTTKDNTQVGIPQRLIPFDFRQSIFSLSGPVHHTSVPFSANAFAIDFHDMAAEVLVLGPARCSAD